MSSSDPIELNQDGIEKNEETEQVEATIDTTDSTEETLKEASSEEIENAAPQAEAPVVEQVPAEEEPVAEEPVAEESPAEKAVVEEQEEKEQPVLHVEAESENAEEVAEKGEGEEDSSEEDDGEDSLEIREDFSEETMLQQIDKILDNETNLDHLIETATPNELILMLDHFYKAEEVQPYIRRVGLIKRAFDGLRDKVAVPKGTLSRFSTALARFNKKRSEYQAAQDERKQANSQLKRDLLVKLKEIVDAEDVNKINEVREIQQEWKKIGHVKRDDMEDLFREYRFLLDSFYKSRELHFQLRDYDRQINLQEKERLLEELKGIIPEEEERENPDIWVTKNDLLTDIQMRWRAVGHVPRDDLDRINDAYREITGEFFGLRREYYESQDESKKENEDKKRELLVKMQAFETYESEKPKDWNNATDQLRVLQEAWKEIGPAPKEVNSELWKAYRNVGNAFFGKKAEFFRQLDEKRNENLTKKRELCEKAEALRDGGEYDKKARDMRMLQEEWKNIGPVPERYSNKLWGRFRAACDAFFESRREHFASRRSEEEDNLKSKKLLIDEVRKVSVEEAGSAEAAIGQIKDIQARWKAIGRVPYKEKDTIWKEFRAEIDQFFDDLRGNRDRSNYAALKEKVETLPEDKRTRTLKGKIQKLRRKMDAISEKVEQYSTNIQFISKGKSGDSLRAQIQKEIDKEKRLLKDLRKQMKQLNELLKNPPQEEEEKEEKEKKAKKAKKVEASAESEEEDAKNVDEASSEEDADSASEDTAEEDSPEKTEE